MIQVNACAFIMILADYVSYKRFWRQLLDNVNKEVENKYVLGARICKRWETIPRNRFRQAGNRFLVSLKGQCHEIFCFWFFSWISFPQAPEYTSRAVLNFFENSRKYSQIKVDHRWQICRRYQRHRRQICQRYQRHRRQILPPVSLMLLMPVANLPPVSTMPAANLPPLSLIPLDKLPAVSTTRAVSQQNY